jgi:hypothetical protein
VSFSFVLMTAAALLADPEPAPDQGSGPEAAFDTLARQALQQRAAAFEGVKPAFTQWPGRGRTTSQVGTQQQGLRVPSLGLPDAATVAQRAQAAIHTTGRGTQAGVTVALLGMAGVNIPGDVQLSLAALSSGATRFGAAAAYNLGPTVDGSIPLAELQVPACEFDEQVEIRALAAVRDAFVGICNEVIQKAPTGVAADEAKRLCGFTAGSGASPGLQSTIATLQKAIAEGQRSLTTMQKARLNALAAFREPRPDDCLTDDGLNLALVRYDWRHMTHELGVGGSTTVLPFHLGFQPDTPLSQGEWLSVDTRASYTGHYQYFDVTVALGWSRARDDATAPLLSTFTWSLSPSLAVLPLSSAPLMTGDLPTLVAGKLPPRLVVGLDFDGALVTAGAPTDLGLSTIDVGVHVDFRFTDSLAVRLGVPFRGTRLVRDSDGASGLSWTLPVSITTVLAL